MKNVRHATFLLLVNAKNTDYSGSIVAELFNVEELASKEAGIQVMTSTQLHYSNV